MWLELRLIRYLFSDTSSETRDGYLAVPTKQSLIDANNKIRIDAINQKRAIAHVLYDN